MPVSAHYRPRPVFLELGSGFSSVVSPERFPRSILRYRNQDWAERVGLGDLTEEEWIDHFCRFHARSSNGSLGKDRHSFYILTWILASGFQEVRIADRSPICQSSKMTADILRGVSRAARSRSQKSQASSQVALRPLFSRRLTAILLLCLPSQV